MTVNRRRGEAQNLWDVRWPPPSRPSLEDWHRAGKHRHHDEIRPGFRHDAEAGLFCRFVRFCGGQAGSFIGGTGTPCPTLLLAPHEIVAQGLCGPEPPRLGLALSLVPRLQMAAPLGRCIIVYLITVVLHDAEIAENPALRKSTRLFPGSCDEFQFCGLHSATTYGNRPSLAPDKTDPPHDAAIAQG